MNKKHFLISLILISSIQSLLLSQSSAALELYNSAVTNMDMRKLHKYRELSLNLNAYGQKKTALVRAIETRSIDIVKEVVEYGKADVSIPCQIKEKKWNPRGGRYGFGDYEFSTKNKYPIQYAVDEKKYDIVAYLIDKGANKNLIVNDIKATGRLDLIKRFQMEDKLRFSTTDLHNLLKTGTGDLHYLQMVLQNGAKPDVWSAVYAIRSRRSVQNKLQLLSSAGLSLKNTYARTGKGLAWGTICECFNQRDMNTLKFLVEDNGASINGYCSHNGVNVAYSPFLKKNLSSGSMRNEFQEYLIFAPSIAAKKKAAREEKATILRDQAKSALSKDSFQLAYNLYEEAYQVAKNSDDRKQQGIILMKEGKMNYDRAYTHFSSAGSSTVWASLDESLRCDLGKYMLEKKDMNKAYSVLFAKKDGSKELTYYQAAFYAKRNYDRRFYDHLKLLKEKGFSDKQRMSEDELFAKFKNDKKFQKFINK